MKKNYIILIISCFIVLFIPVTYYFCYALPKHNERLQEIEYEKFVYEQNRDRLEQERLEQEKADKEYKEREEQQAKIKEEQDRINNYNNCINWANQKRREDFSNYCKLSYSMCLEELENYNKSALYKLPNSECDKYIEKDWQCHLYDIYAKKREDEYNRNLKQCDIYK